MALLRLYLGYVGLQFGYTKLCKVILKVIFRLCRLNTYAMEAIPRAIHRL